jgi:hypothetical protein
MLLFQVSDLTDEIRLAITPDLKKEYDQALILSISRLNPKWNLMDKVDMIRSETTKMFANLYRVASQRQVVNGIENFTRNNGPLNTLTTNQLLNLINPVQLSIPVLTYNLIRDSINLNQSEISLIALTVKTIGFNPGLDTDKDSDDIFRYYCQNLKSIVDNPIPDSNKILQLLLPPTRDSTIDLVEILYQPFGSLKYRDITNPSYIQPIKVPKEQLVHIVTTVISQRLQILPSDISLAVNNLTDGQLSALLLNINNFPRLRTSIIKLGFSELDSYVVDGLMTTKFQQTKKLYMNILPPDKKREGGLLYYRTLLDHNMSEYSPVLLEMYYSPSTILANINRAIFRHIMI